MKTLKIILLSFSLLSAQSSFANFFRQVGLSALVGAGSGIVFQEQRDPVLAMCAVSSYVGLKFFYDVLSAKTAGEAAKGVVAVPLNASVAIIACLITKSITK